MRRWKRLIAVISSCVLAGITAACGPVTQVHPCGCYGMNLENTFSAAPSPANTLTAGQVARLHVVWTVPTAGMVGSPPVEAGADIYFDSWGGVVYKVLARTGAVLWRRTFPSAATTAYGAVGFAGSPAVSGRAVFVSGADTRVYALDARNGAVIWQTSVRRPGQTNFLWGGPQVWGGRVFVGVSSAVDTPTEQGREVALSARSGRRLWDVSMVHYKGGGASVVPVAAVDPGRGLVYVATGNPTPERYNTTAPGHTPPGPDLYSDSMVAFHAASGRIAWYHQTISHDRYDLDFIASVNLFPTTRGLAAGDGEKNATYYALSAHSGKPLWQAHLAPAHTYTTIVATAAYANGRLFVPTMNSPLVGAKATQPYGQLVALNASTGRALWAHPLPAVIEAAPVVMGAFVFVADDSGDVLALRASTGQLVGEWHFPGAVWGGLSAAQGMVLVPVGGSHSEVVALEVA